MEITRINQRPVPERIKPLFCDQSCGRAKDTEIPITKTKERAIKIKHIL
jgi:hypothetical protein